MQKPPELNPVSSVVAWEYDGALYPTLFAAETARARVRLKAMVEEPDAHSPFQSVVINAQYNTINALLKHHAEVVKLLTRLSDVSDYDPT